MDIENNVRLKVYVPGMESFASKAKTLSSEKLSNCNCDNFGCEFICNNYSYQLNAKPCLQKDERPFVSLFLKNVVDVNSKKRIAESLTETDLKFFCKYLSELYACEVYLERCSEIYGNFNVFNGGSDYDVVEEKWFTCIFEKGELVEVKSFTK